MNFVTKISKQLNHPGSEFRGKPFWAWNGKLEAEELQRQIRIMHRMGFGGFFMHSRLGLQTPYLSQEWFDCIHACINEAKTLGMEAWLYDEDNFPSGTAGGIVTKNLAYRMRLLNLEVLSSANSFVWDDSVIAVFTGVIRQRDAFHVRRINKGDKLTLKRGHNLFVFRMKILNSSVQMGQPYLDTLNPKAVKKFIDVTHNSYLKRYGNDFGKTIPGIFTDEPTYGEIFTPHRSPGSNLQTAWTDKLPETFKKKYGYDITEKLVELFYNVDSRSVMRSRHNYYDCVTSMFVKAFAKQIGDWCQKAGILFTGHILFENLLSHQTHAVGSAMRFYEHMHVPGVDLLTEYDREFDSVIQVSSVARQFGRTWRLTETYGCTGWQFPFEGHKAIGEWQAALGMNLRCQHLSWYTMLGEAKRDYPASISYQSPWWELYSKVEDYFARIHVVMTRGVEIRDLLVISPIESTWAIMVPEWLTNSAIRKADTDYIKVRDALLSGNIGFDYGDEDILARHATVIHKSGKAFFKVGDALYTTVLAPPMITIRSSTLKLLAAFRDAGGKVVFAGNPPRYVDVIESSHALNFAKTCHNTSVGGAGLVKTVENCRRVSITDGSGNQISATLHLLREDKDAYYLFVCNYGLDLSKSKLAWHKDKLSCPEIYSVAERNFTCDDVRIKLHVESKEAIEVDCNDGKLYKAEAKSKSGQLEIRTSLDKCGSRLFVIPKKAKEVKSEPRFTGKVISCKRLNPPQWDVSLSEMNNLILDKPAYRINEGNWQKPEEILRLDTSIRKKLGLEPRSWKMCQPWKVKYGKNISLKIEMLYEFHVGSIPCTELSIALENPQLYKILINDYALTSDMQNGWWVDKSLVKIPFSPCILKAGQNTVRLICAYNQRHTGLESIYLLGNFGVRANNQKVSVVKPVSKLKIGDWTKQGLMFYSGSVTYWVDINFLKRRGRRVFIKLTRYQGVAVRIWMNGLPVGVIGWAPWEIDITDFISIGKNRLGIEVFSHRSNSHGPLHVSGKDSLMFVGPFSYRTKGKHWEESYQLTPCGLMGPVAIVKR